MTPIRCSTPTQLPTQPKASIALKPGKSKSAPSCLDKLSRSVTVQRVTKTRPSLRQQPAQNQDCSNSRELFDVIEHIPQIRNYLINQVYRVLKPGGLLIYQTPNKIINIPWEIIKNKHLTKHQHYHCSLQTLHSLNKLLNITFTNVIIEKHNIITEYNINKIKKKLGCLGVFFLHLLQSLPLALYPNFWGYCKKFF